MNTQPPEMTVSFPGAGIRLRAYSLWKEVPHREEKLLPQKRSLLTILIPAFTIV